MSVNNNVRDFYNLKDDEAARKTLIENKNGF